MRAKLSMAVALVLLACGLLVCGLLVCGPGLAATASAAIPVPAKHATGALHDNRLRISPRRIAAEKADALPTAVDLSAWTVPVGDQGQIGSCVSWAISYAMNGWYSRYQGSSTGILFAPMYSYSQVHVDNSPGGGGSNPSAVYAVGTSQGTDVQSDYPQGNYDFADLPTAAERANAANYKTGAFSYLYSGVPGVGAVTVIESAVANHQPVALSLPAYPAFEDLTASNDHLDARNVVPGTDPSGHEVLIIGYDSSGVHVQNSWGTTWGNRGFAWLDWNFVEQYTYEATVMPGLVQNSSPSAPTNAASTTSNSTATLTWAPPASTGGSAITGYRIARDGVDRSGTGAWSTTVAATARSATFSNLVAGTTYHLTVQAINALGTGQAATVTVVIGSAVRVPTVPTRVGSTTASTTATLTWAPPASDGGSSVTGYRIARDGVDASGTGAWSTTVPANSRSATFTNLVAGRTYHLTVQAINAAGTGPAAVVTIGSAVAPPGVPTNTAGTTSGSTATLSWAPPLSNGGPGVTGYRVARDGVDASGTGAWSTTLAATARSATFTNLVAGRTYHLTVQAINAVGTGTGATVTVVVGAGVNAPGAPTRAAGTTFGSTANLSWAPPASDGGAAVTGYRVARDGVDSSGTGAWSTTVGSTVRALAFTRLVAGRTYHLTVQAINAAGTGAAATVVVTIDPNK